MNDKNGAVELIDYGMTPELNWSGVARIERITGDLFRFVGFVEEVPKPGEIRWIRAGSVLLPRVVLNSICTMTDEAIAHGSAYLSVPRERMLVM